MAAWSSTLTCWFLTFTYGVCMCNRLCGTMLGRVNEIQIHAENASFLVSAISVTLQQMTFVEGEKYRPCSFFLKMMGGKKNKA